MKKMLTLSVILVLAAVAAFAGGFLEPIHATYSGASGFTWTNNSQRRAIMALWVQDSVTSTMTVDVVNNASYTNRLVDATTNTILRYIDQSEAVPIMPSGKIIVSGTSTNSVKLSLYSCDPTR